MIHVPTDDGYWVSEEFSRLAEIIKDYDPYLEVRWIAPDKRVTSEDRKHPFCIVDTRSHYIVKYFSELDNPRQVLADLFNIDNRHGNVLQRLDARNTANEAFQLKESMDYEEECRDISAFVAGNKKHFWKHGEVKYDEAFRRRE